MKSKTSKKKIVKKDTLFFHEDVQHGGILFDHIDNPLKYLFSSKDEVKRQSVVATDHDFIPATKSKKYFENSRKKTNKKGGYMTSLFFPGGYSTAASTLGLYALNKSMQNKFNRKN